MRLRNSVSSASGTLMRKGRTAVALAWAIVYSPFVSSVVDIIPSWSAKSGGQASSVVPAERPDITMRLRRDIPVDSPFFMLSPPLNLHLRRPALTSPAAARRDRPDLNSVLEERLRPQNQTARGFSRSGYTLIIAS